MNDQISWDASLVKKFSSSNHFKLLNQLRTEVKKYPLNNKKNSSSNLIKDNKSALRNTLKQKNSQDLSYSSINKNNSDDNSTKSTVSFNNSKNFSIYNNINNDPTKVQTESIISDKMISNEEFNNTTFIDRLNKVDMK